MTDAEIRDLAPRPAAAVRVRAATSELGGLFDTHLPAIAERVADMGVQTAGPPYGRYHQYGPDEIDVEIGIPVTRPLPNVPPLADVPSGDLGNVELPGGRVAVTVHRGPYDGLTRTYESLEAWMRQHGHSPGDAPWESYVDDPTEVEEANLRTEVCWPIRD